MYVFQSPLEALAFNYFNYVSFGFLATNTLQSLFTCVAILTTAVSFWRFTTVVGSNSFPRTNSSSSSSSSSVNSDGSHSTPPPTVQILSPHLLPCLGSTSPDHLQLESEKKPYDDHEASTCNCVRRTSSSSSSSILVGPIPLEDEDENKVNLKAKFTLYYSELNDKSSKEEEEEEDPIEDVDVLLCSSGAPPELLYSSGLWCSDGTSARREGDLLSWYRYQDLTVFNGSVVRLWDCHRRRNTSSSVCFPAPALEVIG
ncbi:uncharacterized protein LOC122085196 [Macadamia integrifolia]|uniref:uncharacterized protein LOC122085196 n=1 Tax=Macadamia integrifolia TaxID=60698 RepID=UPI001C4FEC2D|nr:uncharacterized protein LOC122085196 [Macadamia integrifolia]